MERSPCAQREAKKIESESGEGKPYGDREWIIHDPLCHAGRAGQGLPAVMWRTLNGPLMVTMHKAT